MNKRQLKQGAQWSMIGLSGRMILSFLTAPVIISKIGLEGYGIILFLNLYSYNGIVQFLDFGLPLVLQKKFAVITGDEEQELIQGGFFLMFMLGLLSLVLLVTSVLFTPSIYKLGSYLIQYQQYVYLLGFFILIQFLISFYSSYLLAKAEVVLVKKWEAILNIFWSLWSIVTVLMYYERFLASFLIGNLVINAVGLVLLAKASKISLTKNFLKYPQTLLSENFNSLWKSSFLLKLNGLTFKQSDALIVSLLLNPAGLSLLDISTKFMALGKTIMGKLNEISFVHFNTQNTLKNPVKLENDFFKMLNVQIILISLISFFLVFFPSELLTLWLGNKYAPETILYVKISGIILLLVPYAHLLTNYLIAVKEDFKSIIMTIAKVSVFNIICSIILTNWLGVLGVMISTLAQHAILEVLLLKHAQFNSKNLRYHFKLFFIMIFFLVTAGLAITPISGMFSGLVVTLIAKLAVFSILLLVFFVTLFKKDEYINSLVKSFLRF